MKKVIYLMGGLGNVLYQLNFGYHLKDLGFKVILNISLLESNWITKVFNWKVHNGTISAMNYFIDNDFIIQNKPGVQLVSAILKSSAIAKLSKSKYFGHDFPTTDDIEIYNIFFGYYQNTTFISQKLKYNFSKCYKNTLKSEFLHSIKEQETFVIHFRGGDKSTDLNFRTNYKHALKKVSAKKVFIITDDIQSAQKLIKEFNCLTRIISNDNMLEDFLIIQLAKNKILSRSSFSWWAAEMSDPNCTIIEPKPFYKHTTWQPTSYHVRTGFVQ